MLSVGPPQRRRGVRKLYLEHQGAASCRSAGCPPWWPGVVHLVETLHGLVAVVLAAFQQIVQRHDATVVVDVVAALAGEDLDALDETGGVGRGRRQRVGAVRVPDVEGDLDRLGVDEGRAAGQRDAADPQGGGGEGAQRAGEVLHVVPCCHVAGVAGLQLVRQALHQLILGSGGDYLHASGPRRRDVGLDCTWTRKLDWEEVRVSSPT